MNLRQKIEEFERVFKIEQDGISQVIKDRDYLRKRVAEIAAENESLRMDKKWLQQMHSNLLQTMAYRKSI